MAFPLNRQDTHTHTHTPRSQFNLPANYNRVHTLISAPPTERPSEERVREVTDQMVTIYKIRCMGLIQNDAGTLAKLYSNAFSRHYAGPADAIGKNGGTYAICAMRAMCVSVYARWRLQSAHSALLFFFGNCTRVHACVPACMAHFLKASHTNIHARARTCLHPFAGGLAGCARVMFFSVALTTSTPRSTKSARAQCN